MKIFNSLFFGCILILLCSNPLKAQDSKLNADFKKETISQLSELINDHYVFPDIAKKTGAHLKKLLKEGYFDKYKDMDSFAAALTEEVQSINKDKHMRIRPVPPYVAPQNSPDRMIEQKLRRISRSRSNNGGFVEAKKLEDNVGYLDLRGFAGPDLGAPLADSYMKLLSTADAIIIDLRKNGGGSPHMVQYLCSYFFDQKVHLNSLYWRQGDRTDEFWTLDKVNGKKLPDVPLFVMTSDYTFSGAEEFAYNMQTQKRATLVGQTTGGGANPGGTFPINESLGVFIPTGKAINPITKTNWEGVGVVPEIKASPEETMDKALELAKAAAENYRQKTEKKNKALLTTLFKSLDAASDKGEKEKITKQFKESLTAGLVNEGDINQMGYEYMLELQKPEIAEIIFEVNTKLFPESANVFDSYAEALMHNGKKEEAIKSYQKAVALAKENQDPNLPLFKENLQRVKSDRP
jgi:tetratricopeptide (TPR) repeat protein